jgi:hypothetical protein
MVLLGTAALTSGAMISVFREVMFVVARNSSCPVEIIGQGRAV